MFAAFHRRGGASSSERVTVSKRLERHRFVALWKLAKFDTINLSKQELELFLQGSHFVTRFRVAPEPMTDKDLAVGSKT